MEEKEQLQQCGDGAKSAVAEEETAQGAAERISFDAAENAENADGAESAKAETAKKGGFGGKLKGYFSATRISYLAVFTALSFILRLPWFEFYIIPAVSFLKIDFSGVFVMVAGFALDPLSGVIVSVLKEILYGVAFSQTVGVGELANIIIMLPYILIPTLFYKKHKGIKTVVILLVLGSVFQVVWSVPVNYLLTFPFYLNLYAHMPWKDGMDFYLSVWYWAFLFNFVKTVMISIVTMLVYKPLSSLIKATRAKFERRKASKTCKNSSSE